MAGIIADVQQGQRPGHYDTQNIIDALLGRKGQDITIKTSDAQRTVFTISAAGGVKASYDLGVTTPSRVLVDGYDLKAGMVMMWNGLTANIPACWLLCNGTAGTPDLRDRFIVGAGTSYGLGATAGSATADVSHTHSMSHTHSHSHLMDHYHNHSHTSAAHTHSSAAHTHTSAGHTHTFTSGSASATFTKNMETTADLAVTYPTPAHVHTGTSDSTTPADTGSTTPAATGSTTPANTGTDARASSSDGFSNTGSDATAASASTTGSGGSTTVSILPPYYALYYIQRAA